METEAARPMLVPHLAAFNTPLFPLLVVSLPPHDSVEQCATQPVECGDEVQGDTILFQELRLFAGLLSVGELADGLGSMTSNSLSADASSAAPV